MPPKFDMQKAHELCSRYAAWKGKPATNLEEAALLLPAALDEIERLRGAPNAAIGNIAAGENIIRKQAKRIAELEGAAKADESRLVEAAKKAGVAYFGCDTPDHLADRVLELGDALVEERARFEYFNQSDSECESWYDIKRKRPDLQKRYVDIARQQLRSEGLL